MFVTLVMIEFEGITGKQMDVLEAMDNTGRFEIGVTGKRESDSTKSMSGSENFYDGALEIKCNESFTGEAKAELLKLLDKALPVDGDIVFSTVDSSKLL
jgi:uncharacterized protein YggU (UPF0235/DUF167 family)